MIRYLKEGHETSKLYFTSYGHCEKCKIDVEGGTCIIWSYDTDKPINDTLKSLFDLIVSDFDDIRDSEDLKILDNELHFGSELFDKFNELLKIKYEFKKYEDKYRLFKEEVLSYARKL